MNSTIQPTESSSERASARSDAVESARQRQQHVRRGVSSLEYAVRLRYRPIEEVAEINSTVAHLATRAASVDASQNPLLGQSTEQAVISPVEDDIRSSIAAIHDQIEALKGRIDD